MELAELESLVASFSLSIPRDRREYKYNDSDVVELVNEQRQNQKTIEGLTKELQASSKNVKEKLSKLLKTTANAKKELSKLQDEDSALDKKISNLKREIRDATHKINAVKQKACVTESEEVALQKQRTELEMYKTLTGIRWSFNVPDNKLHGFITNSQNNYVKVFEFDKATPFKKIREILWSYIEEAGTAPWDQVQENKENEQNK